MKKTIIASAIAAAVAAPAAFADVSISGQINQEFYTVEDGDLSSDRNADLVFSASEDLGNGMKAFAKMSITMDTGSAGASQTSANQSDAGDEEPGIEAGSTQVVGLTGSFGTVTFGKQELLIESKVAAMAANDASDFLSNEVDTAIGGAAEATVTYVSPSFNGLTLGLGATADTSGASDDLDDTEIMLQYSNGPLLARVGMAADDSAGQDDTVIGVQYTMGDLTLGVVSQRSDVANGDEMWVGAKYAMGANTIAISSNSSDDSANDDRIISLSHAMSKNVSVYVAHESDGSANADTTVAGMKVAF